MPHKIGVNVPVHGGGAAARDPAARTARAAGADFADSLARETERQSLRFSAHASQRLASRRISLSADDLSRMDQAAQLAAQRGSRDALIMMDDLGLIVNIRNRTVLTALDLREAGAGIVTNIDSTVVVRK